VRRLVGDDGVDYLFESPASVGEPAAARRRQGIELLVGQVGQQPDRGLSTAHPVAYVWQSCGRVPMVMAMVVSRDRWSWDVTGGLQKPAEMVVSLSHVRGDSADGVSGAVYSALVSAGLAQVRFVQGAEELDHLGELAVGSHHQPGAALAHSRASTFVFLRDGSLLIQYVYVKPYCLEIVVMYNEVVPKLWNETIEAHRREVHDAILETTARLVAEHGLLSVRMSQIAEETGIGRATLYKYFPDVEAILLAWHERHIRGHLERLAEVRDQAGDAGERLEAVLGAYALLSHESRGHHDTELAAFLHRGEHVARVQQRLRDMFRDLLSKAAKSGDVRDDVAPEELASYCIHALAAAGGLPSKATVRRLVTITLAGLRPPR
jgi:AcrR family transcriptional regulator